MSEDMNPLVDLRRVGVTITSSNISNVILTFMPYLDTKIEEKIYYLESAISSAYYLVSAGAFSQSNSLQGFT